jgi:hypothetical protein
MVYVRRLMIPYGIGNANGSWTFFNRKFRPLGVISDAWEEWDVISRPYARAYAREARHLIERQTAVRSGA